MSFLSRVFQTVGNQPLLNTNRSGLPMLNELTRSLSSFLNSVNQIRRKRSLVWWYKRIPELTGLVDKVAKDMVYKYHFEPSNPDESGRNKIKQANKFADTVGLRRVLLSQAVDMLVTGEAFGWLGFLKENQVKDSIRKVMANEIFIERKIKEQVERRLYERLKQAEGFADRDGVDEDLLRPRKYRYVASSSIEIIHDQIDIIQYNQVVGINNPVVFDPKEMVRYTLQDVDGKVSGFTPVEAVIVQLELLRFMWQNMLSIHKNGGSPDKLFVIENMRTNDPAFKRIEEQLKKYKLVENKHGNMLFTGKVTIEDLQQIDQMQFKDMGLYITGVIAMQWQIPRSSIPYIIGGTNTKDDTGGNSERGYWRTIWHSQKVFAEIMNQQLWIPHFGVRIVFDNTFVQEDVQVETARQLKLNNLVLENQILSKHKVKVSKEAIKRDLGRSDLELEELSEEELEAIEIQSTLNKQLSRDKLKPEGEQNRASAKRDEQTSTIASRGEKPTGVGKELKLKEWDHAAEIEYKQMMGQEVEVIPLSTFVTIYNQDKSFNPGMPPRVFMRSNDEFTTFKFKSSDFIYMTRLQTQQLDDSRVLLMNLDNIFRL